MKNITISQVISGALFLLGVVLTIVGFFRGANSLVKSLTLEKYPLQSWEEQSCDHPISPWPEYVGPEIQLKNQAEVSINDLDQNDARNNLDKDNFRQKIESDRVEKCLQSLEFQRQTKKIEDITSSIVLLLSGFVLVLLFRKVIF